MNSRLSGVRNKVVVRDELAYTVKAGSLSLPEQVEL